RKPDAADVASQPIGVLRDQPNGIGAVSLVDAHRARRADTVAVQEQHDLPNHLLIELANCPKRVDRGAPPRARRQRTERFLIYTLQRHEHVQRGFGPAASVELVRLAARDRSRHREARNAVCSRRRTWRPNFREYLARLTRTKPASSARSASAASSIWRRPLHLLGKDEVCRDDRICRQSKCQKV